MFLVGVFVEPELFSLNDSLKWVSIFQNTITKHERM